MGSDQGVAARSARLGGRLPAAANRLFVEAVLYRCRAGFPWRDLPQRLGDRKNVHRRYSRWARSVVWQRVFMHLAADADNEYAMIDRTTVRAHQHSAGPR
jgi:transposase